MISTHCVLAFYIRNLICNRRSCGIRWMLRKNHEAYKGRRKLSTVRNRVAENCLQLEIEELRIVYSQKLATRNLDIWQFWHHMLTFGEECKVGNYLRI